MQFTNPTGGSGNPLTNISGGSYGCGSCTQNGGYRFKKPKSRHYKSRRIARGTKKRTLSRKKARKTRGGKNRTKCHKKKTRSRRGVYRIKSGNKKRMRGGGVMPALTPGLVSENISLQTSMVDNNIPSSFGYGLGGDQNTMSGALANPPPHTRYQNCPGA